MTTKDEEVAARVEQRNRFFLGTSDVHLAMDRVVERLDELGIPYAICGAMAVCVHGLKRATDGVNVLLTPEGLAKFKAHALGRGFVEKFPGSRGVKDAETKVPIDFLLTGGVPGDGVMRGMAFPDPKDVAIDHAGKRYVDLATLVGTKVASAMTTRDRWRDWDDVIRLIRSNELGEHFADGLHPYVREKYREQWRIAQMPPAMESYVGARRAHRLRPALSGDAAAGAPGTVLDAGGMKPAIFDFVRQDSRRSESSTTGWNACAPCAWRLADSANF